VSWDPDRYLRFRQERFEPFEDLVRMVTVRPGLCVIDLGCGSGELTTRLADLLPNSDVLGVDSSPEMLQRARPHARPGLRFELRSIESVRGEWDLVFSHAALHWVEGHEVLVARLLSLVRPGGQLAVQLPSNHRHFTQTIIPEVAWDEAFRPALGGWIRRSPVLPVDRYAELLYEAGAREVTVFEKVYSHVLPDADTVAEWLAGTTLVPYLTRLPDQLRELFLDRYRERLRARWPSGPVFFPFRRILFVALRPRFS
jgi:trans-aconitate 2-methyltransferase